MKKNCNKIKNTCGSEILASCTLYEGDTNEVSLLKDDCQLSIEEATQDIYTQIEEINLEALEDSVLNYIKTTEDRVIVKNAFIKIDSELIALKERVAELETIALCKTNIESCNFLWGTLTNSCGDQPTTFKETIQLILDTIQP